uniref:RING-type domain-containing protein n=1 Tax=Vitis vinifera TaxID=29760 RepID=F6GSR5_VITVI|eukprot:XP_019082017.1 PREDICTED: E3 ubiquitin-protein ligase SIS3 isoform X2 [Vitis vinifera]
MAIRGVDFKWYDGFFLSMLATSVIIVAINWKRYDLCTYPLHIWIMVDYTTVFVFRLLMFVDNGLAAGMGLDFGWQQRYARFCGRIVVLSILSLLLYPFLWAWTVIGTLWFTRARDCLPEEGQKWGFLIWLLFSYCGLLCIACMSMGKWFSRRQAHLLRAQQGIPVSEYGVLVDMIRVPDWAFEAAGQEMRGMGQDAAAYHPGLYLTPTQREAVEALIQELPKFRLKAVPTDCSECPICLEEFHVGNEVLYWLQPHTNSLMSGMLAERDAAAKVMQVELLKEGKLVTQGYVWFSENFRENVRGLPCAHNFHVECIDEWLRLNVKCPRCRCSVFPNLDLSALTHFRADSERSSASVVTATRYVRVQPPSQGYMLRLQGFLRPVRTENAGAGNDADNALENAENGGLPVVTDDLTNTEPAPFDNGVLVHHSTPPQS